MRDPSGDADSQCADLGARKIREELDAMMVLGIDPIQRLVVPRVLACMLVATFLGVLIIPGNVFSERDTHFRISYATTDEKLRQGAS